MVAVVVLVAVLVGAALPVLVQLFLTLKTARGLMATSGQRLDGALAEATTADQTPPGGSRRICDGAIPRSPGTS